MRSAFKGSSQEFFQMPAVIGVGPVRSGTSWLHQALRLHPEVQTPHQFKESDFFSRKYEKGIQWYVSNFMPLEPRSRAWADVSPSYISCVESPQRIKSLKADAKIIVSLRDPYSRVLSIYGAYLRYGYKRIGLDEAVRKNGWPWYMEENIISAHVLKFLELFGREKVFFMLFDDLEMSPHELAKDIYGFIGVDSAFTAPEIGERVHSMMMPRSRVMSLLATTAVRKLRHSLELHSVANKAKASPLVRKVLFSDKPAKLEVGAEEKDRAFKYLSKSFNDEIDHLQEIVGRPLQHWKYTG